MNYIDLTHTFTADMPVFPGDTRPHLCRCVRFEDGGINQYKIETGMHVGTHMDAPLHMVEDGKMISEYPPEKFVGRGVFVDARGEDSIHESLLAEISLQKGDIVVVCTGFADKFRDDDYFETYPEVTPEFAQKLIDTQVNILALDTPSPDREPFPIHRQLLPHDVLIIENLANTEALAGKTFEVTALPAKFEADAAPTRVIANIL